ncbi:Helix-turn-helix domain-containing protein [Halogranum amylolyticum]|uniref:Helix-turn-helix domain-containing protein n=1 Tax=Halogranum amylolyticum TaxID=660520 RepID=A0A1H8MYY8_9EURY|nr:helix-turn-helix domain-containing protein [Halogranum amylolyticum]SEO22473.1 Helix-turn-helix domain-containing protein [Halogranum amylolyticum]
MTDDQADSADGSNGVDSTAVLDILGDAVAREILRLGKQRVVTVEEFAAQCDVSEATVYRRLRQLHDLGLVEKCTQFEAGIVTKGAYRTTMDSVTVRVSEDGIATESGSDDEFADAIRTVRQTIDLDGVQYDPKENSVQVSFTLDDDTFRTFLDQYL